MATSTVSARRAKTAPALTGVDKVAARRDELAQAALLTLAERGYANTSLREISQNSEFSHGVLHYYFADKVELIIHCVALYKTRCVRRYDDVDEDARDAADVLARFIAALRTTLVDDAQEQRLWYDMRAQSLFEPRFRDSVASIDDVLRAMVSRILDRYATLLGARVIVDADAVYALLDGVMTHAVQAHLGGAQDAGDVLEARVRALLGRIIERATT